MSMKTWTDRTMINEIRLKKVSAEYAGQIEACRQEFAKESLHVSYIPERIPGLNGLEDHDSVREWIDSFDAQEGRITWYLSVRESDDTVVGFCCLRHRLEYDDDDPEFASHIGYSVRPSERRKGYAKQQLRLVLKEAQKLGIDTVRLICSDTNTASSRTILACGGRYIDSIYGEESGLTVNRYDIRTGENEEITEVQA